MYFCRIHICILYISYHEIVILETRYDCYEIVSSSICGKTWDFSFKILSYKFLPSFREFQIDRVAKSAFIANTTFSGKIGI